MELLLKSVHQFDEPGHIWVDTNFRAVLPGDSVEKGRKTSYHIGLLSFICNKAVQHSLSAMSTYMVSLRRQYPEIGTISIFWTTRKGICFLDGHRQRHPGLEKAANICEINSFSWLSL